MKSINITKIDEKIYQDFRIACIKKGWTGRQAIIYMMTKFGDEGKY